MLLQAFDGLKICLAFLFWYSMYSHFALNASRAMHLTTELFNCFKQLKNKKDCHITNNLFFVWKSFLFSVVAFSVANISQLECFGRCDFSSRRKACLWEETWENCFAFLLIILVSFAFFDFDPYLSTLRFCKSNIFSKTVNEMLEYVYVFYFVLFAYIQPIQYYVCFFYRLIWCI